MDLGEWEVLPEGGFLQPHNEKILSRKYTSDVSSSDFDLNYFINKSSHESWNLIVSKTGSIETVESDQIHQEIHFDNKKFPKFSDMRIYPRIDDDVFELMDECGTPEGDILWYKNTDSGKYREKESGAKIWKRSVSGVGAICSSGVAAAKFCAVILGNHRGNKQRQNRKIIFQICEDERVHNF